MTSEDSAAERKRKRLEEWKRRRQQTAPAAPSPPAVKVSLSLNVSSKQPARKKKIAPPPPKPINPFGTIDDDDDSGDSEEEGNKKRKLSLGLGFSLTEDFQQEKASTEERPSKRRKGRWDSGPRGEKANDTVKSDTTVEKTLDDTLEKFMDKLQAGALGSVATQVSESSGTEMLSIDVGGSMMRIPKLKQAQPSPLSGGVITSEQLAKMSATITTSKAKAKNPEALYTASDWESDEHHSGGGSGVSKHVLLLVLGLAIWQRVGCSH
jgi:hypothetical protein